MALVAAIFLVLGVLVYLGLNGQPLSNYAWDLPTLQLGGEARSRCWRFS
jgi:hypothetical protein